MRTKGLLLLFFFITGCTCLAQQYPFAHYTPRDGLVNSRVRKAYQDSKGRMYFMTFGGLSMYDGARFKNYTIASGLPNNLVNDILEVGEDSLLVATNTCGWMVLTHGHLKKLKINGKHCPVVNCFLKSAEGIIYATADDGLYKLKDTSYEKLNTKLPGQGSPVIFLGTIADCNGFLVFTTNDLRNYTGLFLYDKTKNKIVDVLPSIHVSSLVSDRNGIVWLSTPQNVMCLDSTALSGGQLKLIHPSLYRSTQSAFKPGNIVFNLLNEPVIASGKAGITRYRRDGTKQEITSPETVGYNPQNLFIDRENILWICHGGNGVYKLSNTRLQTPAYFPAMNRSRIKRVKSNAPGSFCILMNDGQVILKTAVATKIYRSSPAINAITLHYDDACLYITDPSHLYAAGIPKSNYSKISFQQILKFSDTLATPARFVNDPNGNLLFFREGNIFVMKNQRLIFTYPFNRSDLVEGMHIDKINRLWVVSRLGGLQIFSLNPAMATSYLQRVCEFSKEFEKISPRCIMVDKNETLWVGTRDHGLLAFEVNNKAITRRLHFQTQNGLTDNFVTSLAGDSDGNIVVGTQTGIDRLLKTKAGNYRRENVTKSNNIFSHIVYVWTDSANSSFAVNSDGAMLQVEPSNAIVGNFAPQLLIQDIRVNGKSIPAFHETLELEHDQRNLTFSVAAPAFVDEKQVTYSYLLTGSGMKKWSDTSTTADITLLNLSPAKYTLRVKAFFHSTVYEPQEARFSFRILPPAWQTWWFRLAAAIVVVGCIIAAIRIYYRRKLERQTVALEKQQAVEKERSRIATDMHDDLGAGLSTIRFLSERVKQNSFSAVTKTDAEKIVFNSNDLVQKMNEIIWAMNEKNDSLEDLLFYSRSYIVEYCEENNLLCEITLPEVIPAYFVRGELRRNVFLTIKESLHNIVKHAAAKKVCIVFTATTDLHISIKDDGRGMVKANGHLGNGLTNMQKRIASVNGTFKVVEQEGILIIVSVPLQV